MNAARLLADVLIGIALLAGSACANKAPRPWTEPKPGMSRARVVALLGRARNWAIYDARRDAMVIQRGYNLDKMRRLRMVLDEPWKLEYRRPDKSLVCVGLVNDVVIDVENGPLNPRNPGSVASVLPEPENARADSPAEPSAAGATDPSTAPAASADARSEQRRAADNALVDQLLADARQQQDEPVEASEGLSAPDVPRVGETKDAVLARLGRPRNWGWPNDHGVTLKPIYNLAMVKRQIPPGQLWMFEYQRDDGSLYHVRFDRSGRVATVHAGPIYGDGSWASKDLPF